MRAEKETVLKNEGLLLLRNILLQNPTYQSLNSTKRKTENNENINFCRQAGAISSAVVGNEQKQAII